MPNRIIKESARTSRTLNKLSPEAERLFWRLLTVADDYGLFEAEPDLLLSTCFPLKVSTLKSTTVEQWFDELLHVRLVGCYDDGERVLGQFLTWENHQQIRAKRAKFPLPTPETIRCQLRSDAIGNQEKSFASIGNQEKSFAPRAYARARLESESNPIQSILVHSQNNGRARKQLRTRPEYSEGFLHFWDDYPRKDKKFDASQVWEKNKLDDIINDVLTHVRWARKSPEWQKDHGKYIPMAPTYLNERRWEDTQPAFTEKGEQWEGEDSE